MYLGSRANIEAVIISGVYSIMLHCCTVVAHPHYGTYAWSLAAFGLLWFCSGYANINTYIYTHTHIHIHKKPKGSQRPRVGAMRMGDNRAGMKQNAVNA